MAQRRGAEAQINTLRLINLPKSIVNSLSVDQREEFKLGEAGKRVEFMLFGDQVKILYRSEIETLSNFQIHQNESFWEFREKFLERRKAIRKKDPVESALHLKDVGGPGAIEVGSCALAGLRNLIY